MIYFDQKRVGFTLPEVLVVVGIFALLLSVTFQTFSDLNSAKALDTSSLLLSSVLGQA